METLLDAPCKEVESEVNGVDVIGGAALDGEGEGRKGGRAEEAAEKP